MKTRTVRYALLRSVVEGSAYRGRDIAGIEFVDEACRKNMQQLLGKYLKTIEIDHVMFKERYHYFDIEQFQEDQIKFGVLVPNGHQVIPLMSELHGDV